jgi:hypothetical protein
MNKVSDLRVKIINKRKTEGRFVRITDDAYAAVAKHGQFGDSFNDALHRLLKLPLRPDKRANNGRK